MKQRKVERASLYSEVTNRIVAELEEGRLPWVQPWDSAACGCTMPQNGGTGRKYSGINVL
ncbi:MAG: ArdC-like ssDNA-binding domain-containing protein, partial [Beijerinckiaceae bacterium]|nr:ArdC-like ssDNA-binding domain-containing protein [Beijerinckiaceae bacterium]